MGIRVRVRYGEFQNRTKGVKTRIRIRNVTQGFCNENRTRRNEAGSWELGVEE